jgi:hypothetical protein
MLQLSREVTIQSKRVIFLLHRLVNQESGTSPIHIDPKHDLTLQVEPCIISSACHEFSAPQDQSSEAKGPGVAEGKLLHIRETLISQLLEEVYSPSVYWQHQVRLEQMMYWTNDRRVL